MKKTTALLFLIMSLLGLNRVLAQVLTKYGDDVSTLDGIMKAYYGVVSVEKGGKVSYERDSLLHLPGANVGSVSENKEGKKALHFLSLRKFHQLSDPYIEKDGFFESEIARRVEKFGAIYHVWSTYESRNTPKGEVIERGINSIELFFDGARFWILGWFFDSESKTNPIPEEYLKNQK